MIICSRKSGDICTDSRGKVCLNFGRITLGIVLGNVMQLAFEAAILYSLEMLYTYSHHLPFIPAANKKTTPAKTSPATSLI